LVNYSQILEGTLLVKSTPVLVFANGQPPDMKTVTPLLAGSPLIVAADGGANYLKKSDLTPHYIVGDLDSVASDALQSFPGVQIIRKTDQNHTDLEKALDFCLELGADDITVFGATGRRLDHEIANLGILQSYSRKAAIRFVDTQFTIRVLRGRTSFQTTPGQLFSLIALQSANGVSLTGAKFALDNATLTFGGRGVSNAAIQTRVTISIRSGDVFLFLRHRDAD